MKKKDIKVRINTKLWEMVKKKIESDFGKQMNDVDSILIVAMLYLYKSKDKARHPDNLYALKCIESPDLDDRYYKTKTICVYKYVMDRLKENCSGCTYSEAIERAIVDYLYLPISFYTDNIKPIYTFVGSKNPTMQSATANAVKQMHLNYKETVLIDGCCGTGALFLGLDTYNWESVTLNDMNPIRTNFLNVLKNKALEFIKFFLNDESWRVNSYSPERLCLQKKYDEELNEYYNKRKNYHKVDCDISISYATLLLQSWTGQFIEDEERIFNRILKILPASLKLQNATITQEDCLQYLENSDTGKLVILDVPYIGTEKECSVKGYDYIKFHKKIADKLYYANYPFLYFCRSSAPKSDKSRTKEEKERIMKMKLGSYFFNKGYYFQKVPLKKDTELLISNLEYDRNTQFQWTDFSQDIL